VADRSATVPMTLRDPERRDARTYFSRWIYVTYACMV